MPTPGFALPFIVTPSPNHDARPAGCGPELVVLHYTGMQSGAVALQRLTDEAPRAGAYPGPWQDPATPPQQALVRASAHYVVAEDGAIHALVPEDSRAWHAGRSAWAGRLEVNDWSIGIEIVNGGHDFGLPAYPDAQIDALSALLGDVCARCRLGPQDVVGHSDIAPGRKPDPGEHFPWRRLAAAGHGLWPEHAHPKDATPVALPGQSGEAVLAMQRALAGFGYLVPHSAHYCQQTQAVVRAFQRRFWPSRMDGVFDQACAAILADLNAQTARRMLAKTVL
jgi:N-acetylmuramoyl-L-alanine amidase